jgi:DNA-binding GntR family transcriptional regulator
VLIDAIEQRDAVRAERAMHDHLMAQLAALKALQRQESRKVARGAAGGRVRGASAAGGRRAG